MVRSIDRPRYLVDTSVWVDYIPGGDDAHVGFLRDLLSNPVAVSINHLIYKEILRGHGTRRRTRG